MNVGSIALPESALERAQRVPSATVTKAEYYYDYAGDDPIDFTDPSGTSLTSFFKDLATHIGLGGAAGAAYGCAVGAVSAVELGPAGMLGVCLISGTTGAQLGAIGGAIEDLQKYVGPIPSP